MKISEDTVVFLLGSNLGDRLSNIKTAQKLLNKNGKLLTASSVYESKSWGYQSANNFLNQVLVYRMKLKPIEILTRIIEIERNMGRVNKSSKGSYSDRTIDIDIQFCGDSVIDLKDLKIPHPSMEDRRFALLPLNEVMSDFAHPILNKTISILLAECSDKTNVVKYEE